MHATSLPPSFVRLHRRLRLAGVIAATTLVACGGDPVSPGDGTDDPPRRSVVAVVVTPTSPSLEVGATLVYTASPRDAEGRALGDRAVRWSSSDESVARVTQEGRVTAVAPGTAWIVAESEGRSGRAHVEVEPARVADLQLSAIAVELPAATSRVLAAVPVDARGQLVPDAVVEYRVRDDVVATVDATGRITGRSNGVTEITVTAGAIVRRVRVVVTVREVAGRWSLSVLDLVGRGTRCRVTGATLAVGQQAELLTGDADAGRAAVECTIEGGSPPYESPFAPAGTLVGGISGSDVALNVGPWRFDGVLSPDGRGITGTVRYREEVGGALVERAGRFTATRQP
jgi:hypothetical protein